MGGPQAHAKLGSYISVRDISVYAGLEL